MTKTLAALLLVTAGCATNANIAETHREDVAARSRLLAIAARNLDDAMRSRTAPAEQEASGLVAKFHTESQHFASAAGRWVTTDNVNERYEGLIDAWVKVKDAFATLKLDTMTAQTWQRVTYEWEKLSRATGYGGNAYEKKSGEKKK
jgi:hypothetical protein